MKWARLTGKGWLIINVNWYRFRMWFIRAKLVTSFQQSLITCGSKSERIFKKWDWLKKVKCVHCRRASCIGMILFIIAISREKGMRTLSPEWQNSGTHCVSERLDDWLISLVVRNRFRDVYHWLTLPPPHKLALQLYEPEHRPPSKGLAPLQFHAVWQPSLYGD